MDIITNKEALKLGLVKHFTGEPCKRGHLSERYVKSRQCVECAKEKKHEHEYYKEYYKKNKERYRRYKIENAEYYREFDKLYRRKNADYLNSKARDRYATDLDYKLKVFCGSMLHRTLNAAKSTKNSSTYECLGYTKEDMLNNLQNKFLPGMSWDNHGDWHIDHIIPVMRYIKSGVKDPSIINHLDNLIPMWAEHNYSKNNNTLEEYLADNPHLKELYGQFLELNQETLREV